MAFLLFQKLDSIIGLGRFRPPTARENLSRHATQATERRSLHLPSSSRGSPQNSQKSGGACGETDHPRGRAVTRSPRPLACGPAAAPCGLQPATGTRRTHQGSRPPLLAAAVKCGRPKCAIDCHGRAESASSSPSSILPRILISHQVRFFLPCDALPLLPNPTPRLDLMWIRIFFSD